MRLDLRWLGVKQKLRVRQTQPLLRIVAQISGEIGGVFGGNHFYEYSRFYRILQAHCKAEQLGSVEQFANEDRVENSGEIRWIARDKPQRAVTIQSLKTIGQLTFYFKVRVHPDAGSVPELRQLRRPILARALALRCATVWRGSHVQTVPR